MMLRTPSERRQRLVIHVTHRRLLSPALLHLLTVTFDKRHEELNQFGKPGLQMAVVGTVGSDEVAAAESPLADRVKCPPVMHVFDSDTAGVRPLKVDSWYCDVVLSQGLHRATPKHFVAHQQRTLGHSIGADDASAVPDKLEARVFSPCVGHRGDRLFALVVGGARPSGGKFVAKLAPASAQSGQPTRSPPDLVASFDFGVRLTENLQNAERGKTVRVARVVSHAEDVHEGTRWSTSGVFGWANRGFEGAVQRHRVRSRAVVGKEPQPLPHP